ncbi:hypothetical protein Leryth_003644 [Lithospermum erythrorhizon]|nr:hypothetical protein Leryth_003644 [Lithospermum erythrorhizon]
MALARFGRQVKRSYYSYGFCVKLTFVVILGLCFVFVWSFFSPSSFDVSYQRENFDEISEPVSANAKPINRESSSVISSKKKEPEKAKEKKKEKFESDLEEKGSKKKNGVVLLKPKEKHKSEKKGVGGKKKDRIFKVPNEVNDEKDQENDESDENLEEKDGGDDVENRENVDDDSKVNEVDEKNGDLANEEGVGEDDVEKVEDNKKLKKKMGPLFDPKTQYSWKLCTTRSKQNYIPCIDFETVTGKFQLFRHHERSCPKMPPMCLVPLPRGGYETPVSWPGSKLKIVYKNVAHPKLAAFIKGQSWVVESGEHLTFPQDQSMFKGGIQHYLEYIEEMVPDIEWGKNIRIVLDIGCRDSSFAAFLVEKGVMTITLGLKDDLVDLAQVALERGFPAFVTPFEARRLPFPSGVFDAIHCGECHVSWHSNGGRRLLEMNRILRPGGYFILSSKHNSKELEEGMSTLTASICWNILADKNDDISEIGVKIYQKPDSNDIYELRRKKVPPLCKETENPDAAWYVPMKSCLHILPTAVEERGTEWPEEWPKRLATYPEWMDNKEKLIADTEHWNSIVNNSYIIGMGIDWSKIRNIMDMKSINGGFAAALIQQNVWVMNVVPVHAPDTLPVIFERGLFGIYHDWCESFGTYPRSYDLLHADHLFSRLKNR